MDVSHPCTSRHIHHLVELGALPQDQGHSEVRQFQPKVHQRMVQPPAGSFSEGAPVGVVVQDVESEGGAGFERRDQGRVVFYAQVPPEDDQLQRRTDIHLHGRLSRKATVRRRQDVWGSKRRLSAGEAAPSWKGRKTLTDLLRRCRAL